MYDIDIRKSLKEYLTQENENVPSIIVDELPICFGYSRVDVAVLNSYFHGFEIKSDNDTLERLPRQIEYYEKVFDTMSIVCTKKWLSKARTIIPSWWGILVAEQNTDGLIVLYRKRKEYLNKNTDLLNLLELTWKEEALKILKKYGYTKSCKSRPCRIIYERIINTAKENNISKDDIRKSILDCFYHRQSWHPDKIVIRPYNL